MKLGEILAFSFAVVTLAKNDEIGLIRTRNSVRLQKDVAYHHHLVIAKSTDATECIASEFEMEQGVTVWTDGPLGIYPAMNWILKRLDSEDFVWFLNSSDFFLHDHVLRDMAMTLSQGNYVWGTSGFLVVRTSGQISSVNIAPIPWTMQDVAHQATCVKVQVLRDIGGFDTDFKVFADGKAMRQVMQQFTPGVLGHITIAYMEGGFSGMHPVSATRELGRLERDYPIGGQASSKLRQARRLSRAVVAALANRLERLFGSKYTLRPPRSLDESELTFLNTQNHWNHIKFSAGDVRCCLQQFKV